MKAQNSTSQVDSAKQQNQKRAKQLKQFLRLMNELNHDIYICIQDKKRGSVHHYTSDINKFGNLHIVQATKGVSLQKIDQFSSSLVKMMENKVCQKPEVDASSASKKDTEASSQEQKSEFSKFMSFDQESSDSAFKLEFGQTAKDFGMFDQKSQLHMGSPKLPTLMSSDLLSQVEVPHEMSYPCLHSNGSLFDFNQEFNNYEDLNDFAGDQFKENHFSRQMYASKKYSEDEIALRVDSTARRNFANHKLFQSGASLHQDEFEVSEEPNEASADLEFD